jgi:hypothetical protein
MASHSDDGADRAKEDLRILPERPVLDVEVVDGDALLDGRGAAEVMYL